jgi:hypothetical protein
MPLISIIVRLRQEDLRFKGSLDYIDTHTHTYSTDEWKRKYRQS